MQLLLDVPDTQGFSDEITRNGFEYIPITSKDIFRFETLRCITATRLTGCSPQQQ
ncbi:MAG: hypothetical protein LBN39_10705 [Planctomycetaceae bacterium]|jgi:hypothetical protein|nr:hypothetical protein [Planctomycetaceae bacterium]